MKDSILKTKATALRKDLLERLKGTTFSIHRQGADTSAIVHDIKFPECCIEIQEPSNWLLILAEESDPDDTWTAFMGLEEILNPDHIEELFRQGFASSKQNSDHHLFEAAQKMTS